MATVEELQTAHANGAPTHFDEGCTNCGWWSSQTRGNKAWRVQLLGDGSAKLSLKGSSLGTFFVRDPAACGNGVLDPGEDSCNCPEDAGPPPLTETDCSDGIDNDCDGLIDAADPDCGLGGVSVDSIDPVAARRGMSGSVTISGAGFASGAIVTFENGQGPAPIGSDVVVVSSTTLTATVDVASGGGNSTRFWDVRVTNPDGSTGVLLDGFAVFSFP